MKDIIVTITLGIMVPVILAYAFYKSYAQPYLTQSMCRADDQHCVTMRYRFGGNQFVADMNPDLFSLFYDGTSLFLYEHPSYQTNDQRCPSGLSMVIRLNPRTCEYTNRECKADFKTVLESFDPLTERTTYVRDMSSLDEIRPADVVQTLLNLRVVAFR